MDSFLFFLLLAASLAGVVGLVALYARRVLDTMLTANFRAAEAISRGRTPAEWVVSIGRQAALRRALLPWLRHPSEAELAARRAARLGRFFARGTFFEDEAARALLLDCLAAAAVRWATMTWDAIRAEAGPETRIGLT